MENLATSNYIQRGLASKRKQELAKALLQKIEASNPGPNDMVSGRVVPNNPIAQALNTFTGGMADSRLRSAEQEQGQLEDEKRNQLVQALSGGKPLTSEVLAQSGASPVDLIKFAKKQQSNISGPVYDFIPTPNGILRVDKRSKETELLPYQAAAQSPQLQGQITAARSGNKLYPLDTMEGRQYQTGYQLNQDLQNQQPQNIQNNQQSGLPSDDVRNVDALNMVEASGRRDPSLKNPNSTASGGLQIIDGTREQLGLPKNAPYEQDEAKIDEYQQSLEKKYGNKGLAGLAHYKGEGYVDQILARKRKLTNDDYIYMGKMEEARYGLANKAKPITPQQISDLKTQQEIDVQAGKNELGLQNKKAETIQDQELKLYDPVRVKAKADVSDQLDRIVEHYKALNELNEMQNYDKGLLDNLRAGAKTTGAGQYIEKKIGTQGQSHRAAIDAARSTLVGPIMRANGLTGSQLNSVPELEQFMKSLTDPTTDYHTVIEQANELRKMHGNGPLPDNLSPAKKTSNGWEIKEVQ